MAMTPALVRPHITWEDLPSDFILPDDPVENIGQPIIAAALREILEQAGWNFAGVLIASNFGLCANVNGKTIVKAPDWVYIPQAAPVNRTRKSYTPHKHGTVPLIVMEYLSDEDGGEYSQNPQNPYGRWYFYEQILKVPIYVIFEPEQGRLEFYRLERDRYVQAIPNAKNLYWVEELNLFLGVWHGTKADRTGNWLRWWDAAGKMLLWAAENLREKDLILREKDLALREKDLELREKDLALSIARQQQAELLAKLQNLSPDQLQSLGIKFDQEKT